MAAKAGHLYRYLRQAGQVIAKGARRGHGWKVLGGSRLRGILGVLDGSRPVKIKRPPRRLSLCARRWEGDVLRKAGTQKASRYRYSPWPSILSTALSRALSQM